MDSKCESKCDKVTRGKIHSEKKRFDDSQFNVPLQLKEPTVTQVLVPFIEFLSKFSSYEKVPKKLLHFIYLI